MPADLPLRIDSHEPLGADHHLLTLALPSRESSVTPWEPGQFAMITLGLPEGSTDPLLRRPFSIYNLPGSPPGVMQIFYKVLGRGSALLSAARPGTTLRCLAPLGKGYAAGRPAGARLLLVAGGIGSASLHPLALKDQAAGGRPMMLYGCRTRADLAGIEPTRRAGVECRVATDDGSAGARGTVTDLLDAHLAADGPGAGERWIVCACGPMPMMKTAAAVATRHGVACHVALESPMACGFGVCVGCVVGTREKPGDPLSYRRICIDGPVFDAAQVCW